jgi:hypothetical protein
MLFSLTSSNPVMVQRVRLFLFNSPTLEHVAYEDYHVAEKGLVVLSMMPGTNSEAHENNKETMY